MTLDLFGEPYEPIIPRKPTGVYEIFKHKNLYRKSEGYRRCGNCRNFWETEYHNKRYFKCALMGHSFSANSDIRKSYVCRKWGSDSDHQPIIDMPPIPQEDKPLVYV